ncbi:hypothetical protein G4B88_013119 [Cannabis sativa]|uniref:Retrotransposon gag domain-containing protein n=1 Tax=Cannabis sativa TaxID=3483 RepID=A0A7J6I2P4_CANSA|nr:hypothetical protein G4B88_013119 [Cannabis sativa]
MDPPQSSRPQGEQVEPRAARTDPPAMHPPPQNLGDNAGADQWMSTITCILDNMGVTGTERVNCAAFMFQEHGRVWWDIVGQTRDVSVMTWEEFKKLFEEKFYNVAMRTSHQEDFVKLTQGKMSVVEYTLEFDRLSKFAGDLVPTDFTRKQKYVQGLNATISRDLKITTSHDTLYKRGVDLALIAEEAEQQVMKEQGAKDAVTASNPPASGSISKGTNSGNPDHKWKAEASRALGGNRKFRGNRGGRRVAGPHSGHIPSVLNAKKEEPKKNTAQNPGRLFTMTQADADASPSVVY